MPDAIKPALTPDEWADGGFKRRLEGAGVAINRLRTMQFLDFTLAPSEALILDQGGPSLSDPAIGILDESRHALAALCLHGQDYGFTHDDVDRLRRLVASQGPNERYFGAWTELADRIAALLPPESA